MKVGLAGLGTVGASVVRLLARRSDELAAACGRSIEVVAVSARDRQKDRGVDLSAVRWYDDPVALARDADIDVFVELMGGEGDPADAAVRAALSGGRAVVTANKALLARHGTELARLAEANSVSLSFEAAVAGGIPVVKTMREALLANRVDRVYGILNGTCNYILTRMEAEGLGFEECLAEAQRLGYAEADPTFDIDGFDAAHKLAILTSLAFGTEVDGEAVYVEGIRSIETADLDAADELGFRIKLLGVAIRAGDGIECRVHPTMVPKSSAIARIDGVLNAVAIDGDALGEIILVGPGAGGDATASAVIADLADIARGDTVPPMGRAAHRLEPYSRARMRRHAGGYYIRLSVADRPGAFAAIATRMAEKGISLESIVQRRRKAGENSRASGGDATVQPVFLVTHDTTEEAVREALAAIAADSVIATEPQVIRIERLDDTTPSAQREV
ncbi:homoserine dehydrogenase [Amorphus orientalis]|uniref:Homoserine dehydrogenase n=1 Tax=Amorphus orientalis TaxID=649198 RepID=A0AAE3VNR7_9HYPH|nr:homoserine dehydrogenase [Amorphus orientalis]